MAYTLPPTNLTNASGFDSIIIYTSQQVPILIPLILLFIYVTIMGVGYFSMERRKGYGNISLWSAIAGLITTTGSFILYLYEGLVNLEVIIICMLITFLSAMFFIFSSKDE